MKIYIQIKKCLIINEQSRNKPRKLKMGDYIAANKLREHWKNFFSNGVDVLP